MKAFNRIWISDQTSIMNGWSSVGRKSDWQ